MSAQKNKTVLAATLAIIGVFLLGGVSFTLFPSQTQTTSPTPQVYNPQLAFTVTGDTSNLAFLTSGNSTNNGSAGNIFSFFYCPPIDSIVIATDGTVNSTLIQRQGDTYKLTEDITNQTIIVEKSGIILDGANHALTGFNRGCAYALENIHLENVTDVTVENFNISLSWQGIYSLNSTDITIRNNNINNINTGITAVSSSNCKVTGNNFVNLSTAVSFTQLYGYGQPQSNTVSKNTINNVITGITLSGGEFNTVTDNVIVNAYDSINAGTNATIAKNTLINGIDAIGVASQNSVYDNMIANFSESGISLSGMKSTIYQNTITNCSSAIIMSGSSDTYPFGDNMIWHNNFVNNTQPVALYTNASLSINYWDNGKEGNYWSSYNGSDSNGDGVGDTPYNLAANCTDNYPLMQPYTVASTDSQLGNLFFAAAAVTALVGAAVIICVYAKFRGRS